MVMTTGQAPRAILPEAAWQLIVQPATQMSVALQVGQVVPVGEQVHALRVPMVTDDPHAAWTVEGEEITPSDAALGEVADDFHKLAGLSIITSELARDTSPAALQLVGEGLARDIARKLDAAFFGDEPAPAPTG